MDKFATHLPILKKLLKERNVTSVFEFGTGMFSTELFAKNCDRVISCEMQSKEWHDKIKENFFNYYNVSVLYMPGPQRGIEYLSNLGEVFDLIFVDGHGDSRWHAINIASKFTNLIASHDTEESTYNWHLINLDSSWERTDFRDHRPWTTVWERRIQ